MTSSRLGATVVAALFATTASARDSGGLVGWVESTSGAPVPGAMISVFGKGLRGSLLTVSDSSGQFSLSELPAGAYTLRALGTGHVPSAKKFVVLPDRDAQFTVSLTPVGDGLRPMGVPPSTAPAASAAAADAALREWQWLVRHRRRSVLEVKGYGLEPPGALSTEEGSFVAANGARPLAGTLELLATRPTPGVPSETDPSGQGSVRLNGRLSPAVEWTVGGVVSETEGRSWRTAAELRVDRLSGHQFDFGGGYGSGSLGLALAVPDARLDHDLGTIFVRHRWQSQTFRWTTSAAARYSYEGFLRDPNRFDASAGFEYRTTAGTMLQVRAASTTLAPAGDLLRMGEAAAFALPASTRLEQGLRASRTEHAEVAAVRPLSAYRVAAHAFVERTRDQLVSVFDGTQQARLANGGTFGAGGVGFTLGGDLSEAVSASVRYTYGRSRDQASGFRIGAARGLTLDEPEFHDVVARMQAVFERTDTHLSAYYRINTLDVHLGPPRGVGQTHTRFDVQLSQGLTFLQPLTRAQWQVVLDVRNLFYGTEDAAVLDEIVVLRPPRRVTGGISVQF